jgi:ribonuclease PH
MFESGSTRAIAVVRGPRTLHPQHMQNPEKGILEFKIILHPQPQKAVYNCLLQLPTATSPTPQ